VAADPAELAAAACLPQFPGEVRRVAPAADGVREQLARNIGFPFEAVRDLLLTAR
jgi:hypothetical protein